MRVHIEWSLHIQDLETDRAVDTRTFGHQTMLHGAGGNKRLGSLWAVHASSGESPVSAPRLLGVLYSPLEPRVAVLVTQEEVGTEGMHIALLRVFGGRLDMRRKTR